MEPSKLHFLLGFVACALSLFPSRRVANCDPFFPNQLHCSARLSLLVDDFSSTATTNYQQVQVDEYVDLNARRSTNRLAQENKPHLTYYNKLNGPANDLSDRQLLILNEDTFSCKPERISDWPLAPIRMVSTRLYPISNLRTQSHQLSDVSIGPSALIYAVGNNLNEFKFVQTVYSKSLMSTVNVFTRKLIDFKSSISSAAVDGGGVQSIAGYDLELVVHASARGQRRGLEPGESLAEALHDGAPLNLKFVGACLRKQSSKINSSSPTPEGTADEAGEIDEEGFKPFKPKRSKRRKTTQPDQRSQQEEKAEVGRRNWDADDFCEGLDENGNKRVLLFAIHYSLVQRLQLGSQVSIEEPASQQTAEAFDASEPFLHPVGIGCWNSISIENGVSIQKLANLNFELQRLKFSAQFIAENSNDELGFVAFDAGRQLLRLDRNGRSNVYDLAAGKSYHTGRFSAASGLDSILAIELSTEKCIVLDMDDNGSSTVNRHVDVFEQLVGFNAFARAHYLGPRLIDHQSYELYELKLEPGSDFTNQPILLRAIEPLKQKKTNAGSIMYLTYYVQRMPDLKFSSIRYIELYEFDQFLKRRTLLNRLEFVQFSWALDVEPESSLRSGLSSTASLFQMEACQQPRAGQASLVVAYSRLQNEHDYQVEASSGKSLQESNLELLVEQLHCLLADNLQISRLNIIDLQLKIASGTKIGHKQKSAEFEFSSANKIVDLRSGISQLQFLGFAQNDENSILRNFLAQTNKARHSLEECLLDSIEWPEINWVARCPEMASCLILKPNEKLRGQLDDYDKSAKSDILESANQLTTYTPSRNQMNLCRVYAVKYSTLDLTINRRSALEQAEASLRTLWSNTLKLNLMGDDFWVRGEVRLFQALDHVGVSLANHAALLTGLRYLAASGTVALNPSRSTQLQADPSHEAENRRKELFHQCQLACQLYEFCGSFSICLRTAGLDQNNQLQDCILSPARLTPELVVEIVEQARKQPFASNGFGKLQQPIKLFVASDENVNSEEASHQVAIELVKDDACSLHPRDFLADYKIIKSLAWQQVDATFRPKQSNKTDVGAGLQPDWRFSTLEDCASLSFERTRHVEWVGKTNFTFCPMDSVCMVHGDGDVLKLLDNVHSDCFVYRRNPTRVYKVQRSTHLKVTQKYGEKQQDAEASAPPPPPEELKQKTLIEDSKRVGLHVTHTFWGLNEEDCARECNLHQSGCLSFDSCRNFGKIMCTLYSIRSPEVTRSVYTPLLKREQDIQADFNVALVNSLRCDHFLLKAGYFEVRLSNLLASEKVPEEKARTESIENSDTMSTGLSESEELINKLAAHSEAEKASILAEINKYSGSNPAQMDETIRKTENGSWHVWHFALGLLSGCLLSIYQQPVIGFIALIRREFRKRSMAHDTDRVERGNIVLEDHLTEQT